MARRSKQQRGRCRAVDCDEEMEKFFCKTCYRKLSKSLTETLKDICTAAAEIYVGRTSDPERRLLEHFVESDRDILTILHWAKDWEEADYFEEMLIETGFENLREVYSTCFKNS